MKKYIPVKGVARKCVLQKCPYCGQEWHWSGNRRYLVNAKGVVDIICRKCKKLFVVNNTNKVVWKLTNLRYEGDQLVIGGRK